MVLHKDIEDISTYSITIDEKNIFFVDFEFQICEIETQIIDCLTLYPCMFDCCVLAMLMYLGH